MAIERFDIESTKNISEDSRTDHKGWSSQILYRKRDFFKFFCCSSFPNLPFTFQTEKVYKILLNSQYDKNSETQLFFNLKMIKMFSSD